jgi:hypothetical protein
MNLCIKTILIGFYWRQQSQSRFFYLVNSLNGSDWARNTRPAKKIKRFLGGNRKLVSLKGIFLVDMPQAM